MQRYGVFSVGQAWFVVGRDGPQLGFPDRQRALDAVGLMLKAHRACGEAAEVLVQDDTGRLFTVAEGPEPPAYAPGAAH
jgi:hypothetical protein